IQLLGSMLYVRPTHRSVRAEGLALDEGYLPMPQLNQVLEGQLGGPLMVQHDVDYTFGIVVTRDCNNRHRQIVVPRRIDRDKAIDGALQKQAGIFVDQISAVTMAGDEVEISLLQQIVLDAAHDHGGISIANFWNDDANGKTALCAERARQEIGPIIEL